MIKNVQKIEKIKSPNKNWAKQFYFFSTGVKFHLKSVGGSRFDVARLVLEIFPI